MSLTQMMSTGLPLNRSTRYFTGTVFPMIVGADGFRDLQVLASLIPGCTLPPIDAGLATTNLQFFTEYNLVESIYGAATRARFPGAPRTKETPDVTILAGGRPSVLLAIAATMFYQPTAIELTNRLQAQRVQLEYLRKTLALDQVHHVALLPAGLARTIGGRLPEAFPIVLWEDLLGAYRTARGGDDYFMGVLALALEQWPLLAAKNLAAAPNAVQNLTGTEIVERFGDPAVCTMSRNGGLGGMALQNDFPAGKWRKHTYEVSSAPEPANANWFLVEAFVARLRQQGQL